MPLTFTGKVLPQPHDTGKENFIFLLSLAESSWRSCSVATRFLNRVRADRRTGIDLQPYSRANCSTSANVLSEAHGETWIYIIRERRSIVRRTLGYTVGGRVRERAIMWEVVLIEVAIAPSIFIGHPEQRPNFPLRGQIPPALWK